MALGVFEISLALMIVVIATGLGTTVNPGLFKENIKKRKAILTGFTCQFGLMPLFAFSLCQMLDMPDALSVGAILVGSAPGGSLSNLFTYWSNGNLSLSIVMSVLSTIAALFMLPLMLVVYVQPNYETESISIPFVDITFSLLAVIIPTFGGMYLRYKSEKWAARAEKGASIVGALFMVAAIVVGVSGNTETWQSPFKAWLVAVVMEPLGFTFGYVISRALGMRNKDCRTIALETGVQNSSLIIAIIALSFEEGPVRDEVLVIPLIYTGFFMFWGTSLAIFSRKVLAKWDEPEEEDSKELDVSEDGSDTGKNFDSIETPHSPKAPVGMEFEDASKAEPYV